MPSRVYMGHAYLSYMGLPLQKYSPREFALLTYGGEPGSYEEAMLHEEKDKWFKAMQEEMKSLHENHTFELVKLPQGKRPLKNKWVFKLKSEENNSKLRYTAKLIVKGFGQKMILILKIYFHLLSCTWLDNKFKFRN